MTVTSKQHNFKQEKKNAAEHEYEKHWGSVKNIQIYRESDESLGITIVCGKVDLHMPSNALGTTSGIFIKSIIPNSAAGRTGLFHTGDRILEVDDVDLREAGHEEAVAAIRSADNPVSFIVQSLVPLDNLCKSSDIFSEKTVPEAEYQTQPNKIVNIEIESLQSNVDISNINKEIKPNGKEEEIEKNSEDDKEFVEPITPKKSQEIDRSSAENLKRSEEDADNLEEVDVFGYSTDSIRKKYANLGNTIMMVQLERGQQGLGLSLAGHKDRNCMAVFVCGLNPKGTAYRMGDIQVGDEILEVNGIVLHGRCHLNASAIIKGLVGPIFKIVISRRKTGIDDIAVRPVTQFPVFLEEEVFEDKFNGYPNVRNIAIQKGNQSLGIMIIEGKHAELGQGIFISDIQDGSAAEKAGLEVGEMILAVNRNSLLDADYPTAANLLKRTEGVVTLILSNPSKKLPDASPVSDNIKAEESKLTTGLKVSAPPSRGTTPIPELPPDPATCAIIPGRNTTIEVITDNRGLGLFFVGGRDTLLTDGIIVVEVFSEGPADKDGRLQAGDQLLDANGVCLKEATNEIARQIIRQTLPKVKLVVFRPENIEYTTIEVDLTRKPGRGVGLTIVGKKCGNGFYISEILNGGNADIDGRITKGDLLVSVNGQNIENLNIDEVGAMLKTISGKATLKFHRYKPIIR